MKKKISYKEIKDLKPCYEPEDIGINKDYKANIVDFINKYRNKVKSKEDILWVLLREKFMTEKELRLFAVWCEREAFKLVENPDIRSLKAIEVVEKYANGEATQEDLIAVSDAASYAVWSDARSAARSAAWGAARSAALSDVWSDARSAQIDKLLEHFENNKPIIKR